jgi:hypothetical protein
MVQALSLAGGLSQDKIDRQADIAGKAPPRIPSNQQQQASSSATGAPAIDPMMDYFNQMMANFNSGPSAAELQAEQDARDEENRIIKGENDRDSAYKNYLNAADTATTYVNKLIDNERANAALLGIDYEITDEMKAVRINDYFATIWLAGDQEDIDNLFEEFGDPEGFEGFLVTRGNEENADPGEDDEGEDDGEGEGDSGAKSGASTTPNSLLDDDESSTLG